MTKNHPAPSPEAIPSPSGRLDGTGSHGRVVVGVDDSPGGRAALRFAAEEAELRKAELHIVCAWSLPGGHTGHGAYPGPLRDAVVEDARCTLDTLACEVSGAHPNVAYVLAVGEPPPARALIGASQHADLVVVGSRGRGGFAGLLLGSVSAQVVHHAHCPVVVVRPTNGSVPTEPENSGYPLGSKDEAGQ